MGRKKRKGAQLKPFCYYCDREFDDEKVLVQHQKAKHFKCSECNRKLDTATGLIVHMLQVHKETISRVPNAIAGRDNPDLIIHGTTGVPQDLLNEKRAKLEEQRDATKDQKTAHTVMGMNIMNGFFNQVAAAGNNNMNVLLSYLFPALANMGSYGAHNIINDPFVLSQLMAQLNQSPQAFAAAIASGLCPQNSDMMTRFPSAMKEMVPPGRPINLMTANPAASTEKNNNIGKYLEGTSKQPSVPWSTYLSQNAPASTASLPGSLFSGPGNKDLGKARLIFDPSDDTVSPEEILAQHYGCHALPPDDNERPNSQDPTTFFRGANTPASLSIETT